MNNGIILRRMTLIFLLMFTSTLAYCQSADSVYNQYLDFNLARLENQHNEVVRLGEEIIPNANKLPEKARINFYFSIGKMYEDDNQLSKALPYYEKVAAGVPDYYVVHRALGYIYLNDVKEIERKLKAAPADSVANNQVDLKKAAAKALPHLEKAQACDPDEDTLAIIKALYTETGDKQGLESLGKRLKTLGQKCVDILEDH